MYYLTMKLLDSFTLNKHDPSGMHKIYDRWAELAQESYESKIDIVDFHGIDNIVFAGMGGSGAIGDIFSSILSKTDIHVSIVKGFVLPKTVHSNTLVVTTSVSGHTSETLAILDAASKKYCKIIAFSSGGKIQEYCAKKKIEHRNFQQIHSPRVSFPIFLYGIMKTLGTIIPIKKDEVLESIRFLYELQKKINSSNLDDKNPSLDLASWISGLPLIYYPFGLQSAAIRFKNSLHENAKINVFSEEISEACHNQIVSWEKPDNVKPILIEGQDDHFTTKQKWQMLKEYFETKNVDYKEVISVQGNILTKLINLIYLLDYTSIYLAVRGGIDPSPIRPIDFIKHRQNVFTVQNLSTHNSQENIRKISHEM